MRLSHFRELMAEEFGAVRAGSLAADHVFAAFSGRTIDQALDAGWDPKDAWRVICAEFDVPPERR